MDGSALTLARIDLAYIALGTVFVFFGLVSCAIAVIRKRGEIRILVWLGIWSGMYGTSLLLRTPTVQQIFPNWVQTCAPFTLNAIRYLLIVAAMLVWSELTLGTMRRLTQAMAAVGAVLALAGIGWFILHGLDDTLLPYNNFLAVCAVICLATVVVVPRLSKRFLTFPNRILTLGTLIFTADALFRNVWGWLRLPRIELPLLDELAFACFLFSFAYVAAQKVFANERRLLSIENELDVARQIQASILPTNVPHVESLRISALYQPMTAVGGDFYEFLPIDAHHVGFLVADVSGHGVPAALIAAMLKVAIQSVLPCASAPAEVMQGLNRVLLDQLHGQFVTAAYMWLDLEKRIGLYSAAGHPPLLRWRAGTLERIECNGLLFGVMPEPDYPVCALELDPGDRFLLCTDGVLEPENAAGEPFGDLALELTMRKNQAHTPAELLDDLLEDIRRWQPAPAAQQDDITLVAVDVL